MTNDEAINVLKNTAWIGDEKQFYDLRDAVEMAVEALKRETSDDAISRQAAIRWVKTECNPYGKPTLDFESGKRVMEHLKTMPSVQPDVIKCKDCKHKGTKNCVANAWTTIFGVTVKDNFYCGLAERRTNETD